MATKKIQILGSFGSNVSVDDTLTQTGQAADAKATGDAINQVQTSIDEVTVVVNDLDSRYYTESEIDSMVADVNSTIDTKSDADHIHDDLYYTETEIDDRFDTMQSDIDSKVDAVEGMGLSTNDYTTSEKDKLATIEANANFYEHPTHTAHNLGLYKVTVDESGHVSGTTLAEKEDIVALGIPEQDTKYDTEISDLSGRIDGVENDIKTTNETLSGVSQELESYKVTNNEAVSTNASGIEANKTAIETIQGDYLTSTDKTQLQDDISKVSEKATANASAIEVLNGEGDGSVKQSIDNAFNEFATNVTNDDVVNTYKELIDYAAKHGPEFTELVGKVDTINTHVGEVETDLSSYKTDVSEQFTEVDATIESHVNSINNPHGVTKEQIGLSNVDDTSDMDKPISTAMQEALDLKTDVGHNHDDLYYDKDEILGMITVEDIDDICESNQGSDENIDLVNVATKYWVQEYYQPKGDYLTDEDIGAHNVATDSHSDIRLLIENISNDFYAFAECDDETLNQLQEVVNYIKNNESVIEGITTSKVNVSDIINNLTTNASDKPLSAAQGVVLKALIDAITVPTKVSELENDSGYIKSYTETDPTVPDWAKTPSKPTYTAEEIGAASTTHKHAVSVTGTNESSTVTGVVTVPTVSKTQNYMTASAAAPVVTQSSDYVLGANTEFTVLGGEAVTTKLAATASGVAVGASGTANAITGFGNHTTAAAITDLNTTTIKNPTVTSVSIPNVTGNDSVTASKVSTTAGSAASWSASVTNGVLSFDWVANTPTDVIATDVSASKVTLGADLSASSVSTTDVTVATGSKSTAAAITDLGTPTTATTLTGVEVTAQPTVTIIVSDDDDGGDVTVATGVSDIFINVGGDNVEALTGVGIAAPAITLTNNASNVTGSVPVVSAVEIGSVSASLQNGIAAAQKWTQGTGTTGALQ